MSNSTKLENKILTDNDIIGDVEIIPSSGVTSIVLPDSNETVFNSDSKGIIHYTKLDDNILTYKDIIDDGEVIPSSGVISIVLADSNIIQKKLDIYFNSALYNGQ